MIDLREWKDLIRNTVSEMNDRDPNWKWSVKYLGKTKVRVRWGYLDYLEEKQNAFIMAAEDEKFVVARNPQEKMIDVFTVSDTPNVRLHELPVPIAIKDALRAIELHAHSRY